ncbi:MAG TPA: hypothetical protein VKA84_23495 [Gemmatimonadaceae bacterium]|nr:hypothetical protein [Gemmatimonadaceae bacterium]
MRALHDDGDTLDDYRHMTPTERIGIMWQLALDVYAFASAGRELVDDVEAPAATAARDAELRLPRHIVRVQRRAR